MAGQIIEFAANGGSTKGYLAKPASGSGPGVVVIQEWWGLVDHIKELCDRLAAEGFVALAPDLYHGSVAREPSEAQKLMMQLNLDQAAKDMQGAVAALKSNGATGQKVGTVGFCMGGLLALYAATLSADVGACVNFYGVGRAQPDMSKLQGPVLIFGGDQDRGANPDALGQTQQAIQAAGQKADLTIYPGAGHAFMNDTRPDAYNADAAKDAWPKMVAHFKGNL